MTVRRNFAAAAALALFACAAARAPAEAEIDSAAIQSLADEIVVPAMHASGVPGAVLVMVDRSGIIVSRGYGILDTGTEAPVDVKTTLFNIGSIGKSFTAIMALQLVESGRLDLDADVNTYLKKIHIAGDKVTVRQLLGHQVGFDVDLTHLFVDLGEDASMSNAEMSRRFVQLRPPGLYSSYSNAGYGLIGLVLSGITGKSYAGLLQENILDVLGAGSGIYVETETDLSNLARCYVPLGPSRMARCEYYPVYRESIQGAGGAAMTGRGMGRYMTALLNEGRTENGRLLLPHSFEHLTDFDAYRFHPEILGFGMSFTELNNSNRPEYANGGSVPGFSSIMKIYPRAGYGIFFSFMGGQEPTFNAVPTRIVPHLLQNRPESPEVGAAIKTLHTLADDLAAAFVPESEKPAAVRGESSSVRTGDAAVRSGTYVASGNSPSLGHRIFSMMAPIRLTVIDEETLEIDTDGIFRKTGPALYENDDGLRIAFRNVGNRTIMAISSSLATFVETPSYRAAGWTVPAFASCVLMLSSGILQILPRVPRARRTAAWLLVLGLAAVLLGLYLELEYSRWFDVVQGTSAYPVAWRLLLHTGLVSMLVWPITHALRRNAFSLRGVCSHAHAILLSTSSVVTVLCLILWGAVGRIT